MEWVHLVVAIAFFIIVEVRRGGTACVLEVTRTKMEEDGFDERWSLFDNLIFSFFMLWFI